MGLSKEGYPKGVLVRAVWDCCHELYEQLGRAPTRLEFMAEIHRREPARKGISTHSRQWGDWMRHHSFKSDILLSGHNIPDEYLEPQRLRVVYTVELLGEVSVAEVVKWIITSNAPLKKSEIEYQFQALTVNHSQRWFHRGTRKDMRSNSNHPMDKFYRSGVGKNTRYVIYAPEKHGIWDIAEDGKTPICIAAPRLADLIMLQLRDENELANNMPTDETYRDARMRMMRETFVREGQPAFRRRLFRAYEGQCAITGCTISELLEAAHLRPYAGAWHSRACFGLLLKTDIHTLFDKGLLWLDNEYRVCLAPAMMYTEYHTLHGKAISLPRSPDDWPLKEHIAWHRDFCLERADFSQAD
ncbi:MULTISPECIES: HNH endonuclease [unclassified Providencia]|uniref:HNH endonuclease n=1 Tax=unclassified Providencia TaxID=2633465 RepID=UPI00234AB62B|nr:MULTISPECIES: HNH endonuclease [unclassified Providencia]